MATAKLQNSWVQKRSLQHQRVRLWCAAMQCILVAQCCFSRDRGINLVPSSFAESLAYLMQIRGVQRDLTLLEANPNILKQTSHCRSKIKKDSSTAWLIRTLKSFQNTHFRIRCVVAAYQVCNTEKRHVPSRLKIPPSG